MTDDHFTDEELAAYLDESLPIEQMASIEAMIESGAQSTPSSASDLVNRLQQINRRRDAGVHTLGEIWRRHRISCPARSELGSYLLGVLADEEKSFVEHHLETIGCRVCAANLEDLRESQRSQAAEEVQTRRRRYFQSSVGHLKG